MNPTPPRQRNRVPVILAVVAAATLLAGVLLRKPSGGAPSTERAFVQAELAGLRELIERNSLDELSKRFAAVAQSSSNYLVWMPVAQRAGVVWREQELVTGLVPRAPLPQMVRGAGGGQSAASPKQWGYGVPIATYALEQRRVPPRRATMRDVPLASWLLAVTIRPDHRHLFTPGTYSGVVNRRCGTSTVREILTSIPFSREMLGGGLFTLDGDLAGVIIECNDRLFAAEAPSLETLVAELTSPAGRLTALTGAQFSGLSPLLAEHLGAPGGILVTAVWDDSPADNANLRPGDVVLAAGESEVATQESLAAAITDQPIRLRVRRAGSTVNVPLDASKRGVPASGVIPAEDEEAVPIREVIPGSKAALAGLQPGDILLPAPGRRDADLTEFLSSGVTRPMYLVVRRKNLREGIFLTP